MTCNFLKMMEFLGGIVAGLLLLIVLLVLTLLAYFKLKHRYADKKYTVEVSIAALVLLVSIGIKFAVVIPGIVDNSEIVRGIAGFFGAIYQGFGGIAFEGLMDVKEGTLACLYYGSSVYAALIIICVITAKTNYEIYSYVLLRLWEFRRDIYVFTDLTEDTLRLAKSIQAQYPQYKAKRQTCRQVYQELKKEIENYFAVWDKEPKDALLSFKNSLVSLNNKKLPFSLKLKQLKVILEKEKERISAEVESAKKLGDSQTYCLRKDQSWDISELLLIFKDLSNPPQNKKCKIVFAGNSLDSFDNKNELCKEVIAHSFLYWSYSNGGKCNKSLAKRLHLNNRNYDIYNRHFAIFAFASDKGIPKEEENSAQVFADMALRKNNPDKLRIEYFVLTKRDICFEAYKRKFEKVCGKQDIGARSRLRIVNEAYLTADCILDDLLKEISMNTNESGKPSDTLFQFFHNIERPTQAHDFLLWTLGFGLTAQSALKKLLHLTAYTYKDTSIHTMNFEAHAFDDNIEEYSGVFTKDHPMIYCTDANSRDKKTNPKQMGYNNGYPKVIYHKKSCLCHGFFEDLDGLTGADMEASKRKPDMFVIALGDDSKNIYAANSLLNDIKNEGRLHSGHKQIIAVHIRDPRNKLLLTWGEPERKTFPDLLVISFGNADDIYSYERLLSNTALKQYNFSYEETSKFVNSYSEIITDSALQDLNYKEFIKTVAQKIKSINNKKYSNQNEIPDIPKFFINKMERYNHSRIYTIEQFWNEVPLFEHESNYAANEFKELHRAYISFLRKHGLEEDAVYENALRLEHERWNLFYIANGWTFNKTKDKKLCRHNCICPFDQLDKLVWFYDLINIGWACHKQIS